MQELPSEKTSKQTFLVALPLLLTGSMYLTYGGLTRRFGPKLGYFLSFVVYWVVWCLLIPLWIIGPRELASLFRAIHPTERNQEWLWLGIEALPVILGYGYEFPRNLSKATLPVLAASLPLSLANSIGEEILWRGVYTKAFPNQIVRGYFYPAIGFGLWHLAPQSAVPSNRPGGALSFVAASTVLGLIFGWVPYQSKAIRWSCLSHFLMDYSGLIASYYLGGNKAK